jgi:hypothetical protein
VLELEVLELEVLELEVLELEMLELEVLGSHYDFRVADAVKAERRLPRTRTAAPPTRGAAALNHAQPAITSHRRDAIATSRPRRARSCLSTRTCSEVCGENRRGTLLVILRTLGELPIDVFR